MYGASAQDAVAAEYGFITVDPAPDSFVDEGPSPSFHYQCFSLPPEAKLLARTDFANQAFLKDRTLGVQFHPELTVAPAEILLSTDPTMLNTEESKQFLNRLDSQQDELYGRTKNLLRRFLESV